MAIYSLVVVIVIPGTHQILMEGLIILELNVLFCVFSLVSASG